MHRSYFLHHQNVSLLLRCDVEKGAAVSESLPHIKGQKNNQKKTQTQQSESGPPPTHKTHTASRLARVASAAKGYNANQPTNLILSRIHSII